MAPTDEPTQPAPAPAGSPEAPSPGEPRRDYPPARPSAPPAGRPFGPGPGRGPYSGGPGGPDVRRPYQSEGQGRRPPMGPRRPMRRFRRGKVCSFCVEKVFYIDYKDLDRIRRYLTVRGKILPRRITGNCARHQRLLCTAIKRARNIALIPAKAK